MGAEVGVGHTRPTANCVPVKAFSKDDPPTHDLNPQFFQEWEWGRRLGWPDEEDMLYRAAWEGGTSRSACRRDTVIHTLEAALRRGTQVSGGRYCRRLDLDRNYASPVRAVTASAQECSRPIQMAHGDYGRALRVKKWRVTTDDSV